MNLYGTYLVIYLVLCVRFVTLIKVRVSLLTSRYKKIIVLYYLLTPISYSSIYQRRKGRPLIKVPLYILIMHLRQEFPRKDYIFMTSFFFTANYSIGVS